MANLARIGWLIGVGLPLRAHAQEELWTVESRTYQDWLGVSCTIVPDMDADGRPDALIGAHGTSCVAFADGKAYLVSGASGVELDVWCGSGKEDGFGQKVTWVRDVDGGGLPDLVVAAPGYDEPTIGNETGRIVMISGETHQALWQLVGEWPAGNFGIPLLNAGDLDGDGFDELVTSANNYGGFFDGRVYVISSKTVQTLRVHDSVPSDNFGHMLTVLDDADGDGVRDYVAYGDNWNPNTLSNDGRADVFSGATGNLIRSWMGLKNETLGYYLGSAGDWDGDGLGDVMCFLYDSTKSMNETVRVYSPATGAVLYEIADPGAKYSAFGSALGVVGDMDGDGRPEYAIGASNHKHFSNKISGCVYLYSGRNQRLLYQFLPKYDGGAFGWSFAGNDDLTGDGIPDLLIGAPNPRQVQPKGGFLTAFAGNDLWLQADPADALVGDTIVVDLRGGEPNLLGLVVLVAIDGVSTFDPLLLAPFDANGELQLSAVADASVSGMEFTLFAYAQNRAGRGPLLDASPFVVTVQ